MSLLVLNVVWQVKLTTIHQQLSWRTFLLDLAALPFILFSFVC